jgi:SAM-dependent methyltransferase
MAYLLGVSREEIRRLDFQEKVWGWMSRALWDRLGVRRSWHCLDVGAGIGCATVPLAALSGRVTALEPSPKYAAILRRRAPANATVVQSTIQDFVTHERFDLIFCRWVFLFIRDLEKPLAKLAALLRPGGYLAVEDYHNYDGLALYPRAPAFERLIRDARRWFRKAGGDLRVAGRLPAVLRRLGLRTVEFRPNLLAGDGRSDVFRWAGWFFLNFGRSMSRHFQEFRREWLAAAKSPDTRFLSPLNFDVVARRP